MKLKKIDRELMYHLSRDGSLSVTELAKLLKTSKQVVSYNLNKLISEGVIGMFYTVIDHSRFGAIGLRMLIKLNQSSLKKEGEIVKYIIKNKGVSRVLVVDHYFDLIVEIVEKDISHFYDIMISLEEHYGKYISEILVDVVRSREMFPLRMFHEGKLPEEKRRIYYTHHDPIFKLDNLDKRILEEIEGNCRLDSVKLSGILRSHPKTIKYRIQRMEKAGVIADYGVVTNWKKLDMVRYRILIKPLIHNREKFKEFKRAIRREKNVIAMKQVVGKYTVEFDLVASNYNEVMNFLNRLREDFSELIRSYDIVHIKDIVTS